MEGIYNRMDRKDKDISKVPGMRLDRRAAVDLGKTEYTRERGVSSTTKATRSSQRSSNTTRPSSSNSSTAANRQRTKRVIEISDIDDDSVDEMDCLSSQLGDADDPSTSQIPVRDASPSDSWDVRATSKKNTMARSNGTVPEPDPKYAAKSNVLAGLKFKKNKKPEDETAGSSQTPSSSQLPKGPATEEKLPVPSPPYASRSLADTRRAVPTPRGLPCSQESVATGAPKPRPKPRPIIKANTGTVTRSVDKKAGPSSSQTSTTRRMLDMVDLDVTPKPAVSRRKKDRSRSPSSSPGRSKKAPSKQGLEAFPAPSPLSTPVKKKRSIEAFPDMSPLAESMSQETDRRGLVRKKSSTSGIPRRFPMSPVSITSPQRASKVQLDRKGKGKMGDVNEKKKGKNRKFVESSEEQTEDESESDSKRKRGALRKKPAAFPMGTQMLASIESPERRAPYPPARSIKRSSEGGSGDEHWAKKSRRVRELNQDSPMRYPFEEGVSISLDPQIDPESLCPYCDMPLPTSPSPLLFRLLSTTKSKSYKDARPANPLGRKAPLAVFATVCQRHRFESKLLPEAESKGWPKTIDWNRLEGRISRMKTQLKALIMRNESDRDEDSDDISNDWEVLHATNAKHRSIFWDELLDEVKKKGLKSISGVQGQFDNFEKAQPGYYGELGSVIIHQTLYNMFPPTSIDAMVIAPLTFNQFLQHVLVPEVALRLIMEDKGLKGDSGTQKALGILRDSSAYGVAMFPEDSSEPGKRPTKNNTDGLGVGDLIVMERARQRRKELEEEEEQERVDEEEEKKALAREQEAELKGTEHASLAESKASLPTSRPRPKPIIRSHSRMDMSSTDTETKPTTYRSPSRSRIALNGRDTDTDSSTDEETRQYRKGIPSSSPEHNDSRRSLSASETKNENYFDDFDDTPRRAPSLEVAAMDINASNRRNTTKGNGRSRASSRVPASSPTRRPTVTRARSRTSNRSRSESSSGVEILSDGPGPSAEKTPVPRKNVRAPLVPTNMDTAEDTPVRGSTPPLVKAARRRQLGLQGDKQKSTQTPAKKYTQQIDTSIQDEYRWLLSSSQSQ